MQLTDLVDFSKPSLFISLGSIAFNPLAWNIVAQNGACRAHTCPTMHDVSMKAYCI